jgi:predicted RNA polymerase sigma factor
MAELHERLEIEDERLELMFTCCHPALSLESQVTLTLCALGGLPIAEIARAFPVSEETIKRRLSRAKANIKATGMRFAVPAEHLLPDRLDAVLAVVYLIYNEGYSGRLHLAAEALTLGRLLASLMPDEPEVHGLLAPMLFHHARREARFSGEELVLLEDQDRSLWDAKDLAVGRVALERAIALRGRGPYGAPSGDRLATHRGANRLGRGRRAVPAAGGDHGLCCSRAVAISQRPRDLRARQLARSRFVRALRGGMYVADATRAMVVAGRLPGAGSARA